MTHSGNSRSNFNNGRFKEKVFLTKAELEKYAGFHMFPAFTQGYFDYIKERSTANTSRERNHLDQLAYERGLECAQRRKDQLK